MKVSAVTDQTGMADVGSNAGDLDGDEAGGLVSILPLFPMYIRIHCTVSTACLVIKVIKTPTR